MAQKEEHIHLLGPHPDEQEEEEDNTTTATTTTTTTSTTTHPDTPQIGGQPRLDADGNAITVEATPAEEEEEEEETLEDYAGMVVTILQPVAITMLLVVWAVKTINVSALGGQSASMVYVEDENDGTGTKLLGALLNALIFLAVIVVTTVLFVILYKYRCLKIIYAWLMFSTCSLLAAFGGYIFYLILVAKNLALDYLTFSIILWNFSVVGIIAIFWHAPQKINQGYLVIISGLLAVYFTRLPEWTTWAILAIVAVYDLFAVLCPRGPLKVLVETAQERKEPIPALLYNASVFMMMAGRDGDNTRHHEDDTHDEIPLGDRETTQPQTETDEVPASTATQPSQTQPQPQPQAQPQSGGSGGKGVKLGLGDFVFYSVLMGRAALFDMLTVYTCFIGIITGLFATLLLLAVYRKALPALPISILFGIIFYFLSKIVLYPYVMSLGASQVFI